MKILINGIEVSPRNIDEIGFKSEFSNSIDLSDRDGRLLSLNVDSLTLPNEYKDIINNWVAQNGMFQGIPVQIQLGNQTLEYYVDLTENTKFRDYDVDVKIKRRKSFDNFNENSRGASFEFLAFKGVQFNTFDIPYIIVPPNQVEMGITLSLSTFVMAKATIEAIRDTASSVSSTITGAIPAVGVGVVSVVGSILYAILKIAFQIAYLIALIIALKKLADQLAELIFPKVRNFKGCKVKDLIEKGCNYYGYTLSSNLLDELPGLTILPVPLVKEKYKGFKSIFNYIQNDLNFAFTKGYPTANDTTPTLWSLIEAVETTFNAETRIVNGVVRIEKKGFFKNQASINIAQSLTLQDKREDEYILNTYDSWKRYYLHYQPDYSDTFTIDNFDNTDIEYSNEATNVVNTDLVTIKGLQDRNIPFALGTRKNELNWIEKRCKDLFKLIDKIASTSLQAKVDARKGVLVVSNQYFGVSKLLYTVNGKQPSNYADYISPTALWNKYHYLNKLQENSYKIKESVKILMNDELFVSLLDNNWVQIDGKNCEIVSMDYKPRQSYATITYREPFDYVSANISTVLING